MSAGKFHRAASKRRRTSFELETAEKFRRRITVRDHAKLSLLDADRIAQIEIDMCLEIVHFIAESRKFLLQHDAIIARQLGIVVRPGALDRTGTVNTVAQMADG